MYHQLKHLSYTLGHIATRIENMAETNHTALLAEAHQILRQNYRKKYTKTPSNQMTLGL